MGVGVVVSFFQFTMESKGIFGLMWLVDLITVISIFILNIYTYLINNDGDKFALICLYEDIDAVLSNNAKITKLLLNRNFFLIWKHQNYHY